MGSVRDGQRTRDHDVAARCATPILDERAASKPGRVPLLPVIVVEIERRGLDV